MVAIINIAILLVLFAFAVFLVFAWAVFFILEREDPLYDFGDVDDEDF